MAFRDFTDRFRGAVAAALQQQVAQDIDRLICMLLEASITLWERDNWNRFNDEEDNCTVQVYHWCKVAVRNDSRLRFLEPRFQWVDVTEGMLAGDESVKSAKRPDLRIEIGGGEVGRSLECKRLARTGGWCRAYVYQGLTRFVLENYGHGEPVGYMIGYMHADTFAELVNKINKQILSHPGMGSMDQLMLLRENRTSSWSRSCHTCVSDQVIQVDHLMVKLG